MVIRICLRKVERRRPTTIAINWDIGEDLLEEDKGPKGESEEEMCRLEDWPTYRIELQMIK
jgi:hypothetical protein